MPYVITDACIDVKDKTCLDACPVDCIYEGGRTLYIQPDECIDCGLCETVCPVAAIHADDRLPEELKPWIAINRGVLRPRGDRLGPAGRRGRQAHHDARSSGGGGVAEEDSRLIGALPSPLRGGVGGGGRE